MIFFSIFVLGFLIRNLERANLDRNGKLDYLQDSFWLVIVSMLTIGYGDITVFVNVSRIVFMLAIAWGVLIYSFFIVSMNVLTTLTESERELYDSIKRREQLEHMRPRAESLVFTFLMFQRRMRRKQKLMEIKVGETYSRHYTREQKVRLERLVKETNATHYFFEVMFRA